MSTRAGVFFVCLMFALPLSAAEIYRWVDESGRTQFSDVVPEKFKKSATRVETKSSEISADQRREAESRAARDKARSAEAAREQGARQRQKDADAAGAASAPRRPNTNSGTDCPTLRRLYRESQECFGPYRTANGTTKAEGFEKCKVVTDPILQCGMESSN